MTTTVAITRINKQQCTTTGDQLAVEEPLQIQLLFGSSGVEQTKNIAITMRTPGNDEELAAGFLYSEAIVSAKNQVISIIPAASGKNSILVILQSWYTPTLPAGERNFYVSSSCGVCGTSSLEALRKVSPHKPAVQTMYVQAADLYALPAKLKNGQQLFHSTGGLHACAVFDQHGTLILLREDVGRHNALDKLVGALFLEDQLPANKLVLLLSGRASFEMVQKAVMAGIEVIAAIGAPSSLAVELAIEKNITLIGFLKEDRFNIYSGPERIIETMNNEVAHQR